MDKVGLITGGGDSPGINGAIRAVVRKARDEDMDVVGFKNGWAGLLKDDKEVLTRGDVSGILPIGGTLLGSSRTNPFSVQDGPEKTYENYKKNDLDAVIAIGGDDTLGVAHKLRDFGVNAVGIPQTIDNDLAETEYSIGFSSALTQVMKAVDQLHTTAYSHHRIMILEVMGRDSGWIALFGGLAGGADSILVPEEPFNIKDVKGRIKEREAAGKNFSIVVISEGASPKGLDQQITRETGTDSFGHVKLGGIGHYLKDQLDAILEMPIRVTTLAYLQRGGEPTAFDRLLATRCGISAVEFCLEGEFDLMTSFDGSEVEPVSLEKVIANSPKPIDDDLLRMKDLFY
ncbi:ATP-dependent 6-phosphofructokinase [Candidatus Bipolaricaulota bacterium]|nr:ATP-dependent 6-phosphofructokinase [Candidatus Bipolaricaulota bacterium]